MDSVRFLNLEYFFNAILELWRFLVNPDGLLGKILITLWDIVLFLVKFALPLGIVILIGAYIWYTFRLKELQSSDSQINTDRLIRKQHEQHAHKKNTRWERVEALFQSPQESDWRLAVIEADVLLDELTQKMGYAGDSLGERLKNMNARDFPYLQDAWDAHIFRNRIAHEGSEFQLIRRDVQHIYMLYKKIFEYTQI